ncbi:MAG: hypothetical protein AAF602_23505, partial [Myxococcota bacterium]
MITVWMLTVGGCGWFAPDLDFLDVDAPEVEAPTERAHALARTREMTVQLPPSSRPEGAVAPAEFGLIGEFERHKTVDNVDLYRIDLPVPSHLLPNSTSGSHLIGSAQPAGF